MKRKAAPSPIANAAAALAPLRARWAALSPRERYLSTLAASAVGILLVWAIAIAPALSALQKVQTQRLALDSQMQQMLALQAEARQLAAQPRIGRDAAVRALQESVAGLGSGAQLQINGERAAVSLRGITATSLAAWLGQARANARAIPMEARLVRSPVRTAPASTAAPRPAGMSMPPVVPAAPGPDFTQSLQNNMPPPAAADESARTLTNDDIRWDGTLVLTLPAN